MLIGAAAHLVRVVTAVVDYRFGIGVMGAVAVLVIVAVVMVVLVIHVLLFP